MNQLTKHTARQIPLVERRFEQIFHRERRGCDCEMPMVMRKWNEALGTLVDVRLCCMAKTVERIAAALGIDAPQLYEVLDFDPRWEWDCDELHQRCDEHGTVEMAPRGKPPAWLLKRLEAKGIEVKNLESQEHGNLTPDA